MLDLLRILVKWRRPLVASTLVAALLGVGWALLATPRYVSVASVLPPSREPAFGGLSALLEQYKIPVPGGVETPFLPTLYASIVRSRRMGKLILDEFALRQVFGTTVEDDALDVLRGRTSLRYTDDGLFLVAFEDEDPSRAAAIVNAYVRHLDEIIQQVNASRAGQTRAFVEGQIARCQTDLRRAEEAMRDFQRQHRAIQIDVQTEGALGLAAELQGRILATQVELDLLRQRALPAAPEVQQKTRELEAMKSQYARLSSTSPDLSRAEAKADDALFPPFESVPDLALQALRLLRDLKVQETLYTLLVQQLEQARIEEQKNTPVLSVLDWADPSSRPVYPRKMLIVALAAAAGAVWVSILAVVVERLRERRFQADEEARLAALRAEWEHMPEWVRRIERLVVR